MLDFLPANHAVQRLGPTPLAALQMAQESVVVRAFADAHAFVERVATDLRFAVTPPHALRGRPVTDISDLPSASLVAFWRNLVAASGVPEASVGPLAAGLAQRSQLVRAFDNPDAVLEWTTAKVIEIVADFPCGMADVEVGRNPGDVLDPYILAANQVLLHGGDLQQAVGATVAHKALMTLEGLMGHLHEEVVGRMRGNVKVAEPRGGTSQSLYDPELNPFPGADIVQPPSAQGEPFRLHQVKSKTGTMNSAGGKSLARQMRDLRIRYKDAEIYANSLVGYTLKGHRSMGGMLQEEPSLIVTVGATAFKVLTRSDNGAELLLSLYRDAFRLAAEKTGYNITAMAVTITEAFQAQAANEGESFLGAILHKVTDGTLQQQDSRCYASNRRGGGSS